MKTKLIDIVNSLDSLVVMSELEIDAQTAYDLGKMIIKFNEENQIYEQKRIKLIEKYGERNSNEMRVKNENLPAFFNELAEFGNLEVETPFEKFIISKKVLSMCPNIKPKHFINTAEFIEFYDDDIDE